MLTRAVIVGAVIVRAGNYCLHGFARKAVVKSAGEENRSGGSAAMRAEGAHKTGTAVKGIAFCGGSAIRLT